MDTLPFQLIYGGKTTRSLPKFKFPKEFSSSINENHLSNTQESLKIFREIVIPYVNHWQQENTSSLDLPALLILDVFRGQLTNEVVNEMKAWYCDVLSSCKYDLFVPTARDDGQWLHKSFLKSKIYRVVFSKDWRRFIWGKRSWRYWYPAHPICVKTIACKLGGWFV